MHVGELHGGVFVMILCVYRVYVNVSEGDDQHFDDDKVCCYVLCTICQQVCMQMKSMGDDTNGRVLK